MEIKLDLNHTYLIHSDKQMDVIHSIIVLHITDKAYHLRWNGGNDTWELKKRFDSQYYIDEDISDFMVNNEPQKNFDGTLTYAAEYDTCYVCHGMGTVPDTNSTAGNKTCPLCQGNKLILKIVKTS